MWNTLVHQYRACFSTLLMGVVGLVMVPFSGAWRKRMSKAHALWRHPFLHRCTLLSSLVDEDTVVRIGPVQAKPHNVSELEILAICSLVSQHKCRNVFEIGTFDGRTARAIAMNLPPDGRVFTLNLLEGTKTVALPATSSDVSPKRDTEVGGRFIGREEHEGITQLWGDSATFDYDPFIAQMDLVFIDGSHTIEYVASDTEIAIRLLKPEGGIIVWHDAILYGVAPFLRACERDQNVPFHVISETTLAVVARVESQFVELKKNLP